MAQLRHPFRIGGPAAASLLINALMIAALLNLGMGRARQRTESPALTVMSLALLKGAEDGSEGAESSEPVTASEAPTAKPIPTPPAPATPVPAMPLVILPASLTSAPAATSQMAAPTTVRPSAPTPTSAAPPVRHGAADGLNANAPPGSSRSYAAKVRSWLYAHKTYPRRARMRREEGTVQVRFVIDRAGMLLEGVVLRKSGMHALDEEASAMMRRASPFPKAPRDVPGDRIEFLVPIDFILPA